VIDEVGPLAVTSDVPFVIAVGGIRQRRRLIAFLKAGFSKTDSERALIKRLTGGDPDPGRHQTPAHSLKCARRSPRSPPGSAGSGQYYTWGEIGLLGKPNACPIAAGGEVITKRPHILQPKQATCSAPINRKH